MGIPIDADEPSVPADEQPVQPPPASAEPSSDPEVPGPDAAEQTTEVEPRWRIGKVSRGIETPEADAIDQAIEVPMDDEDDG
jgi:hypothetical protein